MKKCSAILFGLGLLAASFGQGSTASYLNIKEEGAFLLTFQSVQKELNATPEQVKHWEAMFLKQAADEQAIYAKSKPDAGAEEIAANEKSVEALEKAVAEQALALANESQTKRLKEITLQRLDLEAFGKDDVQGELGLSAAQRKKVNGCVKAYQKRQEDFSADLARQTEKIPQASLDDGPAGQKYRDQMNAIVAGSKVKEEELNKFRAAMKNEVLSALTEVQRTRWESMLGAPFSMGN